MKLRTSFCNRTLLGKNIARFAPVWGVYLLCLVAGLGLMYMDADTRVVNFWFASYMAQCIQVMGVVNLFYAPLVAMLLFGDLFNSRMCNAIHAMPLRRETVFLTNAVSGLLFSLGPTAVMALLSMPLLAGTIVHNAWQIGLLWFVGVNLEFLCFFGIALFCIFCTGNRMGFSALYALINGGAWLIWAVVDLLYTPMLYGVITPTRLVNLLTPVANMTTAPLVEVENYHDLITLFAGRESEAVANFWVCETYPTLLILALVGIGFAALGLVMYRRRDLECAGDVVAVRWLAPVFLVAAAVAGGAAAVLMLEMFFYSIRREFVIYALAVCGIAVGWFAGKMLLERSTRVFRLKNWLGLGVLAVLFAVSLGMTRFDVFGIETRTPDVNKVASVSLNVNGQIDLTEKEDIAQIICLQEMALEDRLEDAGAYPASYIEELGTIRNVKYPEEGFLYDDKGTYDRNEHHYYADTVLITYHMENGRTVERRYTIWASFEEGEIIKEYASRWEVVQNNSRGGYEDELDFKQLHSVTVAGKKMPEELMTEENIRQLLAAVKADCEERTMTQDSYYHTGRFKIPAEMEGGDPGEFYYESGIYVDITTWSEGRNDLTGMWLRIFADSRHSLEWLRAHDLLPYDTVDGNYLG